MASSAAHRLAKPTPKRRLLVVCGWLVHAYTALGAVFGLLAIDFAAKHQFRGSFVAMALATIIDSSDGPMARALEVRSLIPFFDGALLDNIVDYLTYVVAPVFLMLSAGLLPAGPLGSAVAAMVMLASAYGFCRTDAKTEDHFFRGFPSYWNLVAFYLFCFRLGPVANAAVVVALIVMVFVPVKYIYPSRTESLRAVTLTLGIIWAGTTVAAVTQLPAPNPVLLYLSFAFILYYLMASFVLFGLNMMKSHGRSR